MKTIFTSIAAGSLLAIFSAAQQPGAGVNRAGVFRSGSIQPASSDRGMSGGADKSERPNNGLLVYVITGSPQFGAVDLHSGTFLPIGPALPPDVGGGLVQGPEKSLLTLAFSGDLVAIDPVTGKTTKVGMTGLGNCTTPSSPCPRNSANAIGRADGALYATDFDNNLYSVDPVSGTASLIGLTHMPVVPFIPLSVNPDGSRNVINESLFSAHGKLYANFAAAVRPKDGPPRIVTSPGLWEIDRKTGHATPRAPTELGLTSIVNVNETIYAFSVRTGQVVVLDVSTGQTSAVSEIDPVAGLIGGATPARPTPPGRD
jgi:hypothetical protein